MPRYLFLSLLVCFSTVQAAEKTAENDAHDLAYSLGASLGERLRQEVPDLQLQALIDGLQQAYQGKPLALKDDRIEQILRDHDAAVTQADDAPPPEPQSESAMLDEQSFKEKAKPGVK